MKGRVDLTANDMEAVVEHRQAGFTLEAISVRLDIKVSAVRYLLDISVLPAQDFDQRRKKNHTRDIHVKLPTQETAK